ncbi:MAG: response regulator [Phycisphaerae bacterium]|nr:response regulator [Phycisphaerae bacterium]
MATRHHIKVLVVDDDEAVCRTVRLILESNNYQLEVFNDPREALKAAESTAFDIALVDIKMPGLNGVEFVQKLLEIDRRVSPIMMTAYPDVETAAAAMRRGSCDYIPKPFRQEQLLEAVERVARDKGLIYTSEEELNRLIGQRIRQERLRLNLTLRQLSQRTSLTTSQLSQVELGKNAASLWSLAKISSAMGLQLSEMLHGI